MFCTFTDVRVGYRQTVVNLAGPNSYRSALRSTLASSVEAVLRVNVGQEHSIVDPLFTHNSHICSLPLLLVVEDRP